MEKLQSKLPPEHGPAMLHAVDDDYTATQIELNRATLHRRGLQIARHGYFLTLPDEILVKIIKFSVEAKQMEVDGLICYPYGYRPALLGVNKRLYKLTRSIFFTKSIVYHFEHDLTEYITHDDEYGGPWIKYGLDFLASAWEQSCVCGFVVTMLNADEPRLRNLSTLLLCFTLNSNLNGLTAMTFQGQCRSPETQLPFAFVRSETGIRYRFVKLAIRRRPGHTTLLSALTDWEVELALVEMFNDAMSAARRATFEAGRIRRKGRSRRIRDILDFDRFLIRSVRFEQRWGLYGGGIAIF